MVARRLAAAGLLLTALVFVAPPAAAEPPEDTCFRWDDGMTWCGLYEREGGFCVGSIQTWSGGGWTCAVGYYNHHSEQWGVCALMQPDGNDAGSRPDGACLDFM